MSDPFYNDALCELTIRNKFHLVPTALDLWWLSTFSSSPISHPSYSCWGRDFSEKNGLAKVVSIHCENKWFAHAYVHSITDRLTFNPSINTLLLFCGAIDKKLLSCRWVNSDVLMCHNFIASIVLRGECYKAKSRANRKISSVHHHHSPMPLNDDEHERLPRVLSAHLSISSGAWKFPHTPPSRSVVIFQVATRFDS